ncbi:hemerythrin [Clostridia bacterium]|nr:hemerythrin [Clostridia bacterium]
MAVYQWTDDLTTGNTMIDTQHKQLIKAISDLLEACSTGKGRESIEKTIAFLENYTATHFSDEEKLQVAHKYPDHPNHHQLHEGFKKVVHEIGEQIKKDGPTVALVGKVNSAIGGWLLIHIKKEDVKVANWVKNN